MDAIDAIKTRRTIRLFDPKPVEREILTGLIDCARRAAVGGNIQPLEYIIVDDKDVCAKIFPCLAWAFHVKPKRNPQPGQEPTAYIVVLSDEEIKKADAAKIDAAASVTNILTAVHAQGLGACWLYSIMKKKIRDILSVPDRYAIDSVVALGYPAESPIMEECDGEDTRYWLDGDNVLHVPKRKAERITHINKF